eukprot:scaffold3874_cov114-Isochrysis_galbana.AAC.2
MLALGTRILSRSTTSPSRRTPARRRWRRGLPHGHVGPCDGSRTEAPPRPVRHARQRARCAGDGHCV